MSKEHSGKAIEVRTIVLLGATWIVCLSLCAIGIFDRLGDPFAVHNDLTTSIYWMHRIADPGLFPGDLVAEYEHFRSTAFIENLYRIGSRFADPVTMSRYFPFGVICFLTPIGFAIGRSLAGNAGGPVMAITLVVTTWYFGPGPGTSGELAILVNAGLALGFLRGNSVLAGALMILAALIYPPSALVGGGAFFLWLLLDQGGAPDRRKGNWPVFLLCGALSALILAAHRFTGESAFGPMVTKAQMLAMPEFGPYGQLPYFFDSWFDHLRSGTTGLELRGPMIFLLISAGILLLIHGASLLKKLRSPLWLFLAAGVLWFFLAHALLLKLLAPSKYIVQPLAIVLCCICTAGVLGFRSLQG
ncbi:hypothetical protein ACFL4G_07215, partial [Thermodesulfobacteriota bacterium]